MEEPTCPRCKTDDYLLFSDFVPSQVVRREFGAWGGQRIGRDQVRPASVSFRCLKCGHFNGHSVPDGWRVPEPNPKVTPERLYNQTGDGRYTIHG